MGGVSKPFIDVAAMCLKKESRKKNTLGYRSVVNA